MECQLCLCLLCKCEWHRKYYCLFFESVVEIQSDHFWKLTIWSQIEQLTVWINARKSDLCHVQKNGDLGLGCPLAPHAQKTIHMIEKYLKQLDKLCQLIIDNDTM